MSRLSIGINGFSLPLTLVTSTQAILARKRSGKSYTASVEAEELLDAKQQIAVVDPTGAWWGLRSSADGKSEGYALVVFGGDHADAPLDLTTGKAMAAATIEHGFSAIYDVSNMHTEEQVQFVMDFCSELLRLNRTAIHIFMDEADTFAPQKPLGLLQNKCLGTVSRLVKQGGLRGVGFTMITQRPASINKDVLSQVDLLTILRMSAPYDLDPVERWLQSEVSVDFAKQVRAALPSLPVGTAFVASASLGIAEKVEIRKRRTFNSGATPAPGERKAEPKVLAKVDIEKLGKEITASVQRSREESPEYLKRRIAELEKARAATPTDDLRAKLVRAEQEVARLRASQADIDGLKAKLGRIEEVIRTAYGLCEALAEPIALPPPRARPVPDIRTYDEPVADTSALPDMSTGDDSGPNERTGPERKVLGALAQLRSVGVVQPEKIHVCLFAGYGNVNSKGFANSLGALRSAGAVEYPAPGRVKLTPLGVSLAPATEQLLDDRDLHASILGMLSGPEGRIFELLVRAYPRRLAKSELMTKSGYGNANSKGFVNSLGRLRGLGFADYPAPGFVVATPLCFVPPTGGT